MDVFARMMSFIRNCKKLTNLSESAPLQQPLNAGLDGSLDPTDGGDLSTRQTARSICDNSVSTSAPLETPLQNGVSAAACRRTAQSCPSSPSGRGMPMNGGPGPTKISGKFAVSILSPTICLSTISVRQCLDACGGNQSAERRRLRSSTVPDRLTGLPGRVDVCVVQPRKASNRKDFPDWTEETTWEDSLEDVELVNSEENMPSFKMANKHCHQLNRTTWENSVRRSNSTVAMSSSLPRSCGLPNGGVDVAGGSGRRESSLPGPGRQSTCVSSSHAHGETEGNGGLEQKGSHRMRSRLPLLGSSPAKLVGADGRSVKASAETKNPADVNDSSGKRSVNVKTVSRELNSQMSEPAMKSGNALATKSLQSEFSSDSDTSTSKSSTTQNGRSKSQSTHNSRILAKSEGSPRKTKSSLPILGSLHGRKNPTASPSKPNRSAVSNIQISNPVDVVQTNPGVIPSDGSTRKSSSGSLRFHYPAGSETVPTQMPSSRRKTSDCGSRSPRSSSLTGTKSPEDWNLPAVKERSRSQEDHRRQTPASLYSSCGQGSPSVCRRSCHCSRHSNAQNLDAGEGNHAQPSAQGGSALPETTPTKPWAKTLRDYEKSPSPVRSRKSTPENVGPATVHANHTSLKNALVNLPNFSATRDSKGSGQEDQLPGAKSDSVLQTKSKHSVSFSSASCSQFEKVESASKIQSRSTAIKEQQAKKKESFSLHKQNNKPVKSLLPTKIRKTSNDSLIKKQKNAISIMLHGSPKRKVLASETKEVSDSLHNGTIPSRLPSSRTSCKEQSFGVKATSRRSLYHAHFDHNGPNGCASTYQNGVGLRSMNASRKIFADPSLLRDQLPTEESLDLLLAISPATVSATQAKAAGERPSLQAASATVNSSRTISNESSNKESLSLISHEARVDKIRSSSVDSQKVFARNGPSKQEIGICKFDNSSSDIVVEKRPVNPEKVLETQRLNSSDVTHSSSLKSSSLDRAMRRVTIANEPTQSRTTEANTLERMQTTETERRIKISVQHEVSTRLPVISKATGNDSYVSSTAQSCTKEREIYVQKDAAIKVIGDMPGLEKPVPINQHIALNCDDRNGADNMFSKNETSGVTENRNLVDNCLVKKVGRRGVPRFGDWPPRMRGLGSVYSRTLDKASDIGCTDSSTSFPQDVLCPTDDNLNERSSLPVQPNVVRVLNDSLMNGINIEVEHTRSTSRIIPVTIVKSPLPTTLPLCREEESAPPSARTGSDAEDQLINPSLNRSRPFQKSFSFIDSVPELIGMRFVDDNHRQRTHLDALRPKSSSRVNLVSDHTSCLVRSSVGETIGTSASGSSTSEKNESVVMTNKLLGRSINTDPFSAGSFDTPSGDTDRTTKINLQTPVYTSPSKLKRNDPSSSQPGSLLAKFASPKHSNQGTEITPVHSDTSRLTQRGSSAKLVSKISVDSMDDPMSYSSPFPLVSKASVDDPMSSSSPLPSCSPPQALPPPPLHCSRSDALLLRQERYLDASDNPEARTNWYISDLENCEFLDQLLIRGSCASLPQNLKRKPTVMRGQRTVLRPRSAEYAKRKSPELSCFRKSRVMSPESEDELNTINPLERKPDETCSNAASLRTHSRLLQRIFSHRGGTTVYSKDPYQAPFDGLHSPVSTSAESSLSREGDASIDVDDQELNIKINHYRSLSQKGRLPYFSCYGESCHTPPLAIFLSDEDISATVFPLRHVVSEPVTNKPFMRAFSSDHRSTLPDSKTPPVVKERPRSDCFDAKWASHLRHRLSLGFVKESPKFTIGGKQMELSRSDDKGSSSSSFDPWRRNPQSSMNLRSRQHKWMSQPHLIKRRSELGPPTNRPVRAKKFLSLPDSLQRQSHRDDEGDKRKKTTRHSICAKVNFLPGRQMATEFSSDEEDLEEVNLSLSLASESSDRSWTSVVDRQMSLSAESRDGGIVLADALWDHVTLDRDELSFQAGDVIDVIDLRDRDWWWGQARRRGGVSGGWFPASFVRMRAQQTELPSNRLPVEETTKSIHPSSSRSSFQRTRTPSMDRSRLNVIREIVKAESDYVKHLRDVVEGYLERVHKHPEMFPIERIATIFGNIADIYQFSRNFLGELEKHILPDRPELCEIGHCFISNRKGFEIYSEYCNNHPLAIEELCSLQQDDKYGRFFEMCRLQQKMIEIPLEGFLLTPIQKICKYPLQLKELIKYTWPSHPDYASLQVALETMKEIASLINERKRKMESLEKLAHWQTTVAAWQGAPLVECSSELIYSGELVKINARGWQQERVFFLFDHQIIYCKKDLLWRHLLIYRGRIDVDHCVVHLVPDGRDVMFGVYVKNAWKLYEHQKDKWYLLMSRTVKERDRWLQAFEDERKRVAVDRENGFTLDSFKRPIFFRQRKHKGHSKKSSDKHRKRVTIQKMDSNEKSSGFSFRDRK